MLNGLEAAVPSQLEFLKSKNATLATVPSLSLAVAVKLIFAGPAPLAPSAGLVMLTVGGLFGGGAFAPCFFIRINAPKRGNVLAPVGLAQPNGSPTVCAAAFMSTVTEFPS